MTGNTSFVGRPSPLAMLFRDARPGSIVVVSDFDDGEFLIVVTVEESLQAAQKQQVVADLKKRFAEAKPTVEMFQHISATHKSQSGLTVTLLDGTVYKTSSLDFMFTDGLSLVHDEHRIYIPKTSIKSILVHNPGD